MTIPSRGKARSPAPGSRSSPLQEEEHRGDAQRAQCLQKAAAATTGGAKSTEGGTRSWEAHGTQNHTCPPSRVSLLFLLSSLQQASGGVQLLAISQPVSPPRQLGGEPRLITCQETSRRLPSSLQRDLAAPSQVPSEPRCLPALWLPPRPLLQPLQSWDVHAMKSKMLRSRGNNSAGVIGDMSSALFLPELSAPAWPDVPRRAALTREERLELGEHSQARQTCFLKAASKARSVRAD